MAITLTNSLLSFSLNHNLLLAIQLSIFSKVVLGISKSLAGTSKNETFSFEKPSGNSSFFDTHHFALLNISSMIPKSPMPPVLDLRAFSSVEEMDAVPEELHEDPFFQENTDPISYEPLFDPVADRKEPKHIYERSSIIRWLQNHDTSPLTMRPMTKDDLVPLSELKETINKKISDHCLKQTREATTKYTKELSHYHAIEIPQHENLCRNLPLPARVHLTAMSYFRRFQRDS